MLSHDPLYTAIELNVSVLGPQVETVTILPVPCMVYQMLGKISDSDVPQGGALSYITAAPNVDPVLLIPTDRISAPKHMSLTGGDGKLLKVSPKFHIDSSPWPCTLM